MTTNKLEYYVQENERTLRVLLLAKADCQGRQKYAETHRIIEEVRLVFFIIFHVLLLFIFFFIFLFIFLFTFIFY